MRPVFLMIGLAIGGEPGQQPDLVFRTPSLAGWEGHGFSLSADRHGKDSPGNLVTSREKAGETALLHCAFTVPANIYEIHFSAAVRGEPAGEKAGSRDIILFSAGKRIVARQVKKDSSWKPSDQILPARRSELLEYKWEVASLAGKTVRIALIDDEPGDSAYLESTGFHFVASRSARDLVFEQQTLEAVRAKGIGGMRRMATRHFVAMSNAPEYFTEMRLGNCELLYTMFFDHFQRKGFALVAPQEKLQALVFDSQAAFDKFLGGRSSPLATGIYQLGSNRLVMYDFGTNAGFVASRQVARDRGRKIGQQPERLQYLEGLERQASTMQRGNNISTVMHETAHQLSFNCGLLSRSADTPIWLAEGLACYCEATSDGSWSGIGEPNPERLAPLARAFRESRPLTGLSRIIGSDLWLKGASDEYSLLLAYGQSWGLFRWLMEEKTPAMRRYLARLATRRTSEHRLEDFQECFGSNLDALQKSYESFLRGLVKREVR